MSQTVKYDLSDADLNRFPLFASAMYKNLGVPWASSTLAFISIAFIPIPFFLVKVRDYIVSPARSH